MNTERLPAKQERARQAANVLIAVIEQIERESPDAHRDEVYRRWREVISRDPHLAKAFNDFRQAFKHAWDEMFA